VIADPRDFILHNTRLQHPPHTPEIALHLADEVTPIWRLTEEELGRIGLPPPFWAFAWAGGQALARYLLDTPREVRGKTVLDFAAVIATRPDPEAKSSTNLPATVSGRSARNAVSAWPPAQAKAQNGGGRPIRPSSSSVFCQSATASSARCRRNSGASGGRSSRVFSRMKARRSVIAPFNSSNATPKSP